jgi:hypothetical protein
VLDLAAALAVTLAALAVAGWRADRALRAASRAGRPARTSGRRTVESVRSPDTSPKM